MAPAPPSPVAGARLHGRADLSHKAHCTVAGLTGARMGTACREYALTDRVKAAVRETRLQRPHEPLRVEQTASVAYATCDGKAAGASARSVSLAVGENQAETPRPHVQLP